MIKLIAGLVSNDELILERFNGISLGKITHLPDYNIRQGNHTLFLSSMKRHEFMIFRYGMAPSGAKEDRITFEVPVEAPWRTIHDEHILKKDIIMSPDFRKQIRGQRGLMPVDYFILESDHEPFVIFMRDRSRPFALGCIWDAWKKNILDDLTYGFAILTIPAYGTFRKIGIKRMPLIISEHDYREWVNPDPTIMGKTDLMDYYPEKYLNAFPIAREILTSTENSKSLVNPVGEMLFKDEKKDLGLIQYKRRKGKEFDESKPTLGERTL